MNNVKTERISINQFFINKKSVTFSIFQFTLVCYVCNVEINLSM